MIILYPEVFWLFIPILLLLIPAFLNYRKGRRLLTQLGGAWRMDKTGQIYFIKTILFWLTILLFFSFSILALAGISWSRESVKDESSGLDLVFAVDISRSMLARDVSPDRLSRGGDLINSLSSNISDGRFGIVVFKGDGHTLVPLTEDRFIMDSAVSSLSPSLYSVSGSDISLGLKRAIDAFPEGSPARKAIILISDGESLEGNPVSMARECYLNDITLFVVASGTAEGSLIYDAEGKVISDTSGQAVVTRLNQSVLMDMAESSQGFYYNLSDMTTQGLIVQDLQELSEGPEAVGIRFQDQISYRVFLIISLIFLIINLLMTQVRWSRWY